MASASPASREAHVFACKVARSIAEIQESVNNMADVVVFLEVLGYNDETVQKYGFRNLVDLAKYVYDFVDAFESRERSGSRYEIKIPSRIRRLSESLSMIFPWVGSLILLFTAGVSLWMAWGLPAAVTTAFVGAVFLGLACSEALVQSMNRLFSFYHAQSNIGEVKRTDYRHYALGTLMTAAAVAAIFGYCFLARIPLELATIAAVSFATIAFHRISFVILYALRKRAHIIAAYSIAFAILLSVSILMKSVIPDPTARYFGGLGAAFGLLTAFAVYHHYRVMTNSSGIVSKNAPHFYSPLSVNNNTIKSKFSIQLWECLPYSIYGTAFLVMLFGDRVISWIFNPVHASAANGTILPFAFNSVYHAGADLALFVLVPAAILQYVIAEPVYLLANNKAIIQKVREHSKMDAFLRQSYRKLIFWTVIAAGLAAVTINVVAPIFVVKAGGTGVSLEILRLASVGALLLSVYTANGIFLTLMGRVGALAKISISGAALVVLVGFMMASIFGFPAAIWGYLSGTLFAAVTTSILSAVSLRNGTARLFARFI